MSIRKRVRKLKQGKKQTVYDAEVFVRGQRVAYQTFESRVDAELWHQDAKHKYLYGDTGPRKSEMMTLADVIEAYRQRHISTLKEVTQQSKEKPLEYLLSAPIAKVKMSEFSDRSIDLWFDWLHKHPTAAQPGRKYFRQEFRMLRQILNWYRENLDHKFVVPIVKRHRLRVLYKPVVARRPDYFMRREDIQAWIRWLKVNKAKTPVYSELAIFMVHTGARVSEACGLHWDAVDLQSGIASIIRTVWWDRHSREPRIQNSTKTDGSVRIMHLPGPVISMLREMKLRSKPGAPVFAANDGDYLRYPAIQNAFNVAFEALGMPWRSTHICRHSFGTLALMASRDLSGVQAALGHSDIRETQRYAKVVALMDGKIQQQTADFIGLNHSESPPKTLPLRGVAGTAIL